MSVSGASDCTSSASSGNGGLSPPKVLDVLGKRIGSTPSPASTLPGIADQRALSRAAGCSAELGSSNEGGTPVLLPTDFCSAYELLQRRISLNRSTSVDSQTSSHAMRTQRQRPSTASSSKRKPPHPPAAAHAGRPMSAGNSRVLSKGTTTPLHGKSVKEHGSPGSDESTESDYNSSDDDEVNCEKSASPTAEQVSLSQPQVELEKRTSNKEVPCHSNVTQDSSASIGFSALRSEVAVSVFPDRVTVNTAVQSMHVIESEEVCLPTGEVGGNSVSPSGSPGQQSIASDTQHPPYSAVCKVSSSPENRDEAPTTNKRAKKPSAALQSQYKHTSNLRDPVPKSGADAMCSAPLEKCAGKRKTSGQDKRGSSDSLQTSASKTPRLRRRSSLETELKLLETRVKHIKLHLKPSLHDTSTNKHHKSNRVSGAHRTSDGGQKSKPVEPSVLHSSSVCHEKASSPAHGLDRKHPNPSSVFYNEESDELMSFPKSLPHQTDVRIYIPNPYTPPATPEVPRATVTVTRKRRVQRHSADPINEPSSCEVCEPTSSSLLQHEKKQKPRSPEEKHARGPPRGPEPPQRVVSGQQAVPSRPTASRTKPYRRLNFRSEQQMNEERLARKRQNAEAELRRRQAAVSAIGNLYKQVVRRRGVRRENRICRGQALAARTIQRVWRGKKGRDLSKRQQQIVAEQKAQALRRQEKSATAIQKLVRGVIKRRWWRSEKLRHHTQTAAHRKSLARRDCCRLAALDIQGLWKGYKVRQRYTPILQFRANYCARVIQRWFREHLRLCHVRDRQIAYFSLRDKSTITIQSAWRVRLSMYELKYRQLKKRNF